MNPTVIILAIITITELVITKEMVGGVILFTCYGLYKAIQC